MKIKRVTLALMLIAIVSVMLSGCKKEEMHLDNHDIKKETIEQMLRDVYTPESMEKFHKAREKYIDTILNRDIADKLFVHNGNEELTEDDLARELQVKVAKSSFDRNSYGETIFKCDISLKYKGNTTEAVMTFYQGNDGKIYKYNTNIK